MFDIWPIPLAIVTIIIAWIGFASVRKGQRSSVVLNEQDRPIPRTIEEHPFTLNPILWALLVATIFCFTMIFYYWASSGY